MGLVFGVVAFLCVLLVVFSCDIAGYPVLNAFRRLTYNVFE